ncbi:thermonuclease family protein [Brucella thiophenivorans]|uniref:Thermonuclease family protein n=1 Tax=Brucella thiophenivorans TaxID=571255 RepID=A0A256FKC0_9HYPH|nr:thermonuclease family protein [Brucella thiophenivorans]OYR15218.1 hypothetical protein CEV31_3131 [Brucella thiophenivorans]
MTKPERKSHARIVFGVFAGLTGAILVTAFVSPFYGALDRPVTVVEGGEEQGQPQSNSGNGIVVEQFDYNEPAKDSSTTQVTEPNAQAGDGGQAGLEREPARPPLSDLGLASTPTPPEPPAPAVPVDETEPMQLLQRPVAIAAGKLESQGRIVDLQGIEAVPIEQTCEAVNGESWPCGMQARTAFRQWLRSRAILCRLPQNDSGAAIATQCSVGNDDPALWLVTNGWARAIAGSAYQEAGEKAETAKLGLYGDKPETALPELDNEPSVPLIITPEAPQQPVAPQPLDGDFPPAPQN